MESVQSVLLILNSLGLGWLLLRPHARPKWASGRVVIDSCILIDGRILEMVSSGFLHSGIIIPQFVLRELQLLADGKDAYKRNRARYGLEVAEKLQQLRPATVTVDDSIRQADKTDELLIILAKKRNARLLTTDYNLGKVAAVEGVTVLNLNDLALAVRTTVLPGEEKEVKIIQVGDTSRQGIGYLDDGVMVVIYGAAKLVGTTQTVIIERMLQTVSGRMCFAHLKSADTSAKRTVVKKKLKS